MIFLKLITDQNVLFSLTKWNLNSGGRDLVLWVGAFSLTKWNLNDGVEIVIPKGGIVFIN
ncbi:hypothetical protein C518_1517 [Lysinibacillus fusiformis ZB2]|nr:hypothetical protein C518_1517 [Lysinibacillus fusiformis ZB2]